MLKEFHRRCPLLWLSYFSMVIKPLSTLKQRWLLLPPLDAPILDAIPPWDAPILTLKVQARGIATSLVTPILATIPLNLND